MLLSSCSCKAKVLSPSLTTCSLSWRAGRWLAGHKGYMVQSLDDVNELYVPSYHAITESRSGAELSMNPAMFRNCVQEFAVEAGRTQGQGKQIARQRMGSKGRAGARSNQNLKVVYEQETLSHDMSKNWFITKSTRLCNILCSMFHVNQTIWHNI